MESFSLKYNSQVDTIQLLPETVFHIFDNYRNNRIYILKTYTLDAYIWQMKIFR